MDAPPPPSVLPEVTVELVPREALDGTWDVLDALVGEGMSQLYEAVLLLATDDPHPDVGELLGKRLTLRMRRAEVVRQVHGVVCRSEDVEQHRDGRALVRVWVVPELWFLSRRRDSRIFAHESVPQIVRRVLDEAGLYAGGRLSLQLDTSPGSVHAVREYCVQYQESDLDFVRRLLEEEGTSFYFRHDADDAEVLVLADGERASLEGTYVPLDNGEAGHEVSYVTADRLELERTQCVGRFQTRAEVRSTSVTLREFESTNPRLPALWTAQQRIAAERELAVYEHPARMTFTGEAADVHGGGGGLVERFAGELRGASGGLLGAAMESTLGELVRAAAAPPPYPPLPRFTGNTGGQLAVTRLQEHQAQARVYDGEGVVLGLTPGHWFELADHPRSALEQAYLVTWVEHELHAGEMERDDRPRYRNRFGCIPRAVPLRPPRRTPRPRIHGTQTATVVGGPTEEMHVDAYGRVRVQFHWDRQHHFDDNLGGLPQGEPRTVCWVRCAQAWAGPHWGSVFIPRVGMEVVVTFFEGDPDHPVVVGCVYNGANPPPYALPGNYHRSTIMSRSIPTHPAAPGRIGFNELRFDDLSGREQIYLHAEKDLTEVVRDHHETYVGGAHDVEVRGHQTNHVGGMQQESIARDQQLTVGGSQAASVHVNRELRVGGVEVRVASGGRFNEAATFEGRLVHGYHLHYVLPAEDGSATSRPEVAELLAGVRMLAQRAAGAASEDDGAEGGGEEGPEARERPGDGDSEVDWSGEGGEEAGEEGEGEADSGGAAGTEDGPLERYIVDGNREKRVTGWERVELGERHVNVSGNDHVTADGRLLLTGDMVGIAATGGTSKGLALLPDEEDRVRLFRGGDQELVMTGEGVGIRDTNDRYLSIASEGTVELYSKVGPVQVTQGDDGDAGLEVSADGETAVFAKGGHCYVEVREHGILVRADDQIELRLSSGGASIKLLSDGSLELVGNPIKINGSTFQP